MRQGRFFLFLGLLFLSLQVFARPVVIEMYSTTASGRGDCLGFILAKDTRRGLLLVPSLYGLSPGYHGFHLHTYPSCKDFAKEAGPHWDPEKTGRHLGPYRREGHLGDLPALYVDSSGRAKRAVIAVHLTQKDLQGRALVIHANGDTYTDEPTDGGGGPRVACGVIE